MVLLVCWDTSSAVGRWSSVAIVTYRAASYRFFIESGTQLGQHLAGLRDRHWEMRYVTRDVKI
jgi:hypothetical protein